MRNETAIPKLAAILADDAEDTMVRHEAGEALGAIGSVSALPILEAYLDNPCPVIKETCQLSVERIKRLHDPLSIDYQALQAGPRQDLPFVSVDPAVGDTSAANISDLESMLVDESKFSLYERYRAMFTLRNRNNRKAVLALCRGFGDSSALFRHEIAYVLGQLADPAAIPALADQLALQSEHPMVRHECAEALGAIATEEANAILEMYLNDKHQVVKESVLIALDILEHEQSSDFQYASAAVSFKEMKEAATIC